jgi:CHASE2 domain-containing sensor protein
MKKIVLFCLSILAGIIFEWAGLIIDGVILSNFRIFLSDEYIFLFIPIGLTAVSIIYFIFKKMGWLPIVGILLGLFIGFILLSIGLAGA